MSMGHRERLKSAFEYDCLPHIRGRYKYTARPGVCAAAKRQLSKRARS
jgi:hypothetical protein